MRYLNSFSIGESIIGNRSPTYFIADIGANHDGDLERAKDLIHLASAAGADCAKFQHFEAHKIVSSYGFSSLSGNDTHQASWDKSVSEVYDQYHAKREWNDELIKTCRDVGIEFMTTPYDDEAVRIFDAASRAFKVGSGDITYHHLLRQIAETDKPVLLATGASTMQEVESAVDQVLAVNPKLCVLQCNTNYTGSLENFSYINLRVLQSYADRWPGLPLGLSDHTQGHTTVLGAVALGACLIEKHFTDDTSRSGPDHGFAMDPASWRAMVVATRELEGALGDGVKRVESNEEETRIVQRRAVRTNRAIQAGSVLKESDLVALRPCPADAIDATALEKLAGRRTAVNKAEGEEFYWSEIN